MKSFPSLIVVLSFFLSLMSCQRDPGLLRPNSAVEASDGSIYINDFGNHRIVKLSSDGTMLMAFGRLGEKPDQLYRSWDLTIGTDGNLYLCNFVEDDIHLKNDEIKVFAPNGKFLREIGRVDYAADEGSTPNKPYGLDVDDAGNLYVADYSPGTIRVFGPQGALLTTLLTDMPEARQYIGLNDVAVDDVRSLLYVVDFDGSRLDQYRLAIDAQGIPSVVFLQTLATYGYGDRQIAFAQYLAVDDTTGRLYVGDTGNRRVQVFEADGEYAFSIPAPGVKEWQIMGVSLGMTGNLYVSDAYNNAVWVFSFDGSLLQRIEVAR